MGSDMWWVDEAERPEGPVTAPPPTEEALKMAMGNEKTFGTGLATAEQVRLLTETVEYMATKSDSHDLYQHVELLHAKVDGLGRMFKKLLEALQNEPA